jgi:hypothetical protein
MTYSARKLQSAWRLYHFLNVGPKIRREKFFKAAQLFQKYARGYLIQKKVLKQLAELKVNNCFEYFKEVQRQRELQSRQIIKYHVTKYFIKRKATKIAEAQKKAKELADLKKKQASMSKSKSTYGGNSSLKRKTSVSPSVPVTSKQTQPASTMTK